MAQEEGGGNDEDSVEVGNMGLYAPEDEKPAGNEIQETKPGLKKVAQIKCLECINSQW